MRVETFSLAIFLALGAGVVGAAACGSNVTETTGSSNAGGQKGSSSSMGTGGVPMTSVVASTVGPSSTSGGMGGMSASSSSGGFGGGVSGQCSMECALVQQCFGFDGCSQFGINCAMPNPNADCIISCISMAMPTCNNLQGVATGCFQSCMGGMTTTGTGATSSSGGMMQGCQQCTLMSCGQQAFPCFQNQQCMGWLGCIQACNAQMPPDPTCAGKCDAMFPTAEPLYDPIYACTCANCPTECANDDPCSHAADGGAADGG